jgi:hypothetical protein
MVTVLITSFLIIAAISYAFYCWQRPSSKRESEYHLLPPPRYAGLFGDENKETRAKLPPIKTREVTADEREALLARATRGDKTVLTDALATSDTKLYDETLDALIELTDSDKQLLALVSYVARHEGLLVNGRLAEKLIDSWKHAPERRTVAEMLHVAALAGEAKIYERAVETAYQIWREGRVEGLLAEELRQLCESEFWLLSSSVRNSGAGFVLKRRLAGLRRELTAAEHRG